MTAKSAPYPPCTVTAFWLKYQDPVRMLRRVTQPPHIAGPLCLTYKLTATMKTLLISCILGLSLLGNVFSQDQKVSLEQTSAKWIESKIVGDKYLIQCYIPEQKSIPIDSLPIVFVLDADMTFGLVYDIVRWLRWGREIPYVAVIGISYGTGQADWWKKRSRDFTESKDATKHWGDWPLAGGAANFKGFIEKELFPFIENEYNLKGDVKTIIGLSFGGQFCTDLLFSKPELFDNYIILGPSLLWNDKELFKQESKYFEKNKILKAHVCTSIGNLDNDDIKQPWTEFVDQVKSRNYLGLTLSTWVIENETHLSMLPASVARGLKTTLKNK
jgi:predicted alpha/beta superfamily hydrolase